MIYIDQRRQIRGKILENTTKVCGFEWLIQEQYFRSSEIIFHLPCSSLRLALNVSFREIVLFLIFLFFRPANEVWVEGRYIPLYAV